MKFFNSKRIRKTVFSISAALLISQAAAPFVKAESNLPQSSDISYIQYAIDLAANDQIGYGHGWVNYNGSTLSCSGLVGISLTRTGFGNFEGDYYVDGVNWGYCPIEEAFKVKLNEAGFYALPYDPSILQPGDILFYDGHVGFYAGEGYSVESREDLNLDGDNGIDASGQEVGVFTDWGILPWVSIYRNDSIACSGEHTCSADMSYTFDGKKMTIKASNLDLKDSHGNSFKPAALTFACWTNTGGQDDLVWLDAVYHAEDNSYYAQYSEFQHLGCVYVDLYTSHEGCSNIFVQQLKAFLVKRM